MSPSNKNRFLVRLALFSALWSILETTLGMIFKGMRLPFGGALMSGLAMILILTSRAYIPYRGSIVALGLITALIRFISTGVLMPGPTIAIIMETALAEMILLSTGYKNWSVRLTAVIGVLYTMVHPFITHKLLFGLNTLALYQSLFEKASEFMHLSRVPIALIVLLYSLMHILIGLTAGMVTLKLTRHLSEKH